MIRYLKETTAPEDDVLVLGNRCVYYLEADRSTANRFFFQTPPINNSDELYNEFLAECDAHPSDVILANGTLEKSLSGKQNFNDFIRRMEAKCKAGEYTFEDHGDFFVYRRVGKDPGT